MPAPRSRWRAGAVLLILLGILMSFGAPGVGAQAFTCADFNNPDAAQILLDSDPDLEDALDPDGDGVACNDDGEDAVTDEAAYLAAIGEEVATIKDSLDDWEEIQLGFADPMVTESQQQELSADLAEIYEWWRDYPDVAASFDAPEGYEDIQDAYLDLANMLRDMSLLFEEAVNEGAGSDESDAAIDELMDTYVDAGNAVDDLEVMLDEAGAGQTPDDAAGDAYLATIQGEVDAIRDSLDRFAEIDQDLRDPMLSDTRKQDMVAESLDIIDTWIAYPEVAAGIDAPEGYEDIHDAYLDLADAVGEAGTLIDEAVNLPTGSDEANDALADFGVAFADAQDAVEEVQDLLDVAGSGQESIASPLHTS